MYFPNQWSYRTLLSKLKCWYKMFSEISCYLLNVVYLGIPLCHGNLFLYFAWKTTGESWYANSCFESELVFLFCSWATALGDIKHFLSCLLLTLPSLWRSENSDEKGSHFPSCLNERKILPSTRNKLTRCLLIFQNSSFFLHQKTVTVELWSLLISCGRKSY